jgi:AhpD family alkylhydroperoxidase
MKHFIFAALFLMSVTVYATDGKTNRSGTAPTETQFSGAPATYADIQKVFGFVPTFMKQFPPEGITGAWEEMKAVQMNQNTSLSGKQKELIALAVAAQVPCHYCTYFHTEAAKMNGATTRDLSEAAAMSALTRKWSTILNGAMQDMGAFRKQADQMIGFAKEQMKSGKEMAMTPESEITSSTAAFEDMKKMFGTVPDFMKAIPEGSVAGAWKEMRGMQMNPNTSLTSKEKELMGVAVAAQIPCHYCEYFHTEAAKLNGASNEEIKEALSVASSVRHWSAFVNGMQMDEKLFKQETNRAFQFMKKQKAGMRSAAK